ncbi:MAG: hypothetical protein V6Z86_05740 [Hyphomicrobiales bacterium]
MTTFRAPLRVYDANKDIDSDAGWVTAMQTNTMVFGDTTKDLFNLPANSQIIDFYVDVTTAFNAATTNTLDLGVSGTPARFADNLALGTAERVLGSSDASQLDEYASTGTTGITVQGVYAQTGAAATAGAARISVLYAVQRVLSL